MLNWWAAINSISWLGSSFMIYRCNKKKKNVGVDYISSIDFTRKLFLPGRHHYRINIFPLKPQLLVKFPNLIKAYAANAH